MKKEALLVRVGEKDLVYDVLTRLRDAGHDARALRHVRAIIVIGASKESVEAVVGTTCSVEPPEKLNEDGGPSWSLDASRDFIGK